MKILESLHKFKFIKSLIIEDFKVFNDGFYLKLSLVFQDASYFYAREFCDSKVRKYSYHWQKSSDGRAMRWDNAPNHPEISTYPHHLHIEGSVRDSFNITLEEALAYIERNYFT